MTCNGVGNYVMNGKYCIVVGGTTEGGIDRARTHRTEALASDKLSIILHKHQTTVTLTSVRTGH